MEDAPLICVVCGQDARHEPCPCEDPGRPFPPPTTLALSDGDFAYGEAVAE